VSKPGRARHRLTRAAWVPVLLSVLMFGLLQLTGNSWFLLLAGAAIGVFGLATTSRASISDLTLSLRHEHRVAVGEELELVLAVRNEGSRTTSPVSLLVQTDGLADVTAYVGPLWPGESADLQMRRHALRRGVVAETRIDMTSSPSLGLVRAYLHRDLHDHVTIHPPRREGVDLARTRRLAEDVETDAVRGAGPDPLGVREWRHGDDHRHVHWRSTARHGRLVVLERGETPVLALRLAFVGPSDADGFEVALASAASACDRALRSGQQVTVAAWLLDGATTAQVGSRLELLDWWSALSDVVLPDARMFARSAAATFGAGDLVVAGPDAALDLWFAQALAGCAPMVLHRLEVGA
jgi:uncharacterized protein (DUF58 family)